MENVAQRIRAIQYLGVFLIALSTLMFEVLLTRIFSVTMWYHFAFMAISIAMCGMTFGALIVYLRPAVFTQTRALQQMGTSALQFGLAMAVCFLAYLCIPFVDDRPTMGFILYTFSLLLIYVVITIPFVFSGICLCIALTRFPRGVSRLYAADLAGAALGCLLIVYVLHWTDGPTAVFVVAVLALISAACFYAAASSTRGTVLAGLLATAVTAFVIDNTHMLARQTSRIPLLWVKGHFEHAPLYQKWNTFSRITVRGNPNEWQAPEGWGQSPRTPPSLKVRSLTLAIDAAAATRLTAYAGNVAALEHLKYDVVNLGHYLCQDGSILVIGAGGGRDVLSALAFGQRHVTAVELNGNILRTVNQVYGDFTGHLDRDPRVSFVNDEGRSFLERDKQSYDMIQISMIDTWAATAAGAFTLSENSLYTQEAWKLFVRRLSPNGVLSVSRWYLGDFPGEAYRLVTLARGSLEAEGIQDVRRHLFMARSGRVATLLLSRRALSSEALTHLKKVCADLDYEVILADGEAKDATMSRLVASGDISDFVRQQPINIAAPTDNSPFFFNMLKLSTAWKVRQSAAGTLAFNLNAVSMLLALFLIVLLLSAGIVLLPFILGADRRVFRGSSEFFVLFAGIGLGFMMVEIAVMQRLTVFLGHPVYGLTVMLFGLLLASGTGSLTTAHSDAGTRNSRLRVAGLLGVLVVYGFVSEPVIHLACGGSTPLRISVALALIVPLGFFMGMMFPLGMKAALARTEGLGPWLWGVNGGMSVIASVLAVIVALARGIHAAYWMGVAGYVVAVAALLAAVRRNNRTPASDRPARATPLSAS